MVVHSTLYADILAICLFFCGTLGSVEEGKVASFLLATTGIVKLRHSISRKKMLLEVGILAEILQFLFSSKFQHYEYYNIP